jgi:hypothetical protein
MYFYNDFSWSYGIFLWEVFSLGGVPYPGIDLNKITRMIQDGYRMEQPAQASDEMYVDIIDIHF